MEILQISVSVGKLVLFFLVSLQWICCFNTSVTQIMRDFKLLTLNHSKIEGYICWKQQNISFVSVSSADTSMYFNPV